MAPDISVKIMTRNTEILQLIGPPLNRSKYREWRWSLSRVT